MKIVQRSVIVIFCVAHSYALHAGEDIVRPLGELSQQLELLAGLVKMVVRDEYSLTAEELDKLTPEQKTQYQIMQQLRYINEWASEEEAAEGGSAARLQGIESDLKKLGDDWEAKKTVGQKATFSAALDKIAGRLQEFITTNFKVMELLQEFSKKTVLIKSEYYPDKSLPDVFKAIFFEPSGKKRSVKDIQGALKLYAGPLNEWQVTAKNLEYQITQLRAEFAKVSA